MAGVMALAGPVLGAMMNQDNPGKHVGETNVDTVGGAGTTLKSLGSQVDSSGQANANSSGIQGGAVAPQSGPPQQGGDILSGLANIQSLSKQGQQPQQAQPPMSNDQPMGDTMMQKMSSDPRFQQLAALFMR